MTQSFSSGSTIFGNTIDDRHEFTGSVFISGSLSVESTTTGSFGRIEATSISASLIEVDANTIKIGGQTIDEADATVLNATSGTNTGDITLAGSGTYISLSNQVITVDGIDISDDTNLAASTGITLSGDTLSTNDAEIVHDSLSGFETNEHIDHSGVSIATGLGLSGGGDITTTRTLAVDFSDNTLNTVISCAFTSTSASIASDIQEFKNGTVTLVSGSSTSTGSFGHLILGGSGSVSGDFTVGGTLIAQEFRTELTTATHILQSGSTAFGNSQDDIHKFTGSLNLTGSINTSNSITASFFKGDGSALTGLTAAAITSYTSTGNNRILTSIDASEVQGEDCLLYTSDAADE